MYKPWSIKKLISASVITLMLFTAVPNSASAGPLLCAGSATAAAAGWLGYGIFKVLTAPVTIWTTPAEVAVLAAAGTTTVELVIARCGAPTP